LNFFFHFFANVLISPQKSEKNVCDSADVIERMLVVIERFYGDLKISIQSK